MADGIYTEQTFDQQWKFITGKCRFVKGREVDPDSAKNKMPHS
jgi:hypothetical protein